MEKLVKLISFVMAAHTVHARKEKDRYRRWDRETPYFIHPIWCAMTLLAEDKLSSEIRAEGAQVLLLHDILEDTTERLPDYIDEEIVKLVLDMTYESSEVERRDVWSKSAIIKLLKLYDKVSNWLDNIWMDEKHLNDNREYILRLTQFVRENYGELNIVIMAESLVKT